MPFSMEVVDAEVRRGREAAAREVASAPGADPLALGASPFVQGRHGPRFPSNRQEFNRKWKAASGRRQIHRDFRCAIFRDPAAVWRAVRRT